METAEASFSSKFHHCLGTVLGGSSLRLSILDHRPLTLTALCSWARPSPPHSGSLSTATSSFCSLCRAWHQ